MCTSAHLRTARKDAHRRDSNFFSLTAPYERTSFDVARRSANFSNSNSREIMALPPLPPPSRTLPVRDNNCDRRDGERRESYCVLQWEASGEPMGFSFARITRGRSVGRRESIEFIRFFCARSRASYFVVSPLERWLFSPRGVLRGILVHRVQSFFERRAKVICSSADALV